MKWEKGNERRHVGVLIQSDVIRKSCTEWPSLSAERCMRKTYGCSRRGDDILIRYASANP